MSRISRKALNAVIPAGTPKNQAISQLRARKAAASKIKAKKAGKPRKAFVKNPMIEIRDLHKVPVTSPNHYVARRLISVIEMLSKGNIEIPDSDMQVLNAIAIKLNRAERVKKRTNGPTRPAVDLTELQMNIFTRYTRMI